MNGIQEVRGSIPLGSTGALQQGCTRNEFARVAELVDAQGSGPCGGQPREGSSPSPSMIVCGIGETIGRIAHVLELVDRLV